MDKNLPELWKIVLGEIETEASRAQFLTFFKKSLLVSLDDKIATIAIQSSIGIDLLKKRFSGIIKKTLSKHTSKDYILAFVAKTIPDTKINTDAPLFSQEETSPIIAPKPLSKPLFRVRSEFSFATMAVSSSNQLAFVSAQTVAKNLGHSYNPLFIYGPVGVGKTHLMQAIANEVYEKDSEKKIIYITSEEFTNEVVEAIRGNDTSRMKKRFRSADLLIIDDVQFIAGKDRVQEELFHTFNILIDKTAQVVLSSDRPPHEIKKLETRLSSRFAAGLTVDIETPDFELRTAILLIKAKKYNVVLPINEAKLIAEKTLDARSLEGVLLRIITEAKTNGELISENLISRVLNAHKKEEHLHLHPNDIINKVCAYYNLKPTQIKGPKRDAGLVRARQIAMLLLKQELRLTFSEIGNILGGRDHTTIMYGVEKLEKLLSTKDVSQSPLSMDIMGIKQISLG
ncbi:MAG: chromosomal replication initiator protein DnaA [Candidatus Levyibacteriota bacterium]|nr:MAG: chromosomal replication initiator protein DnaA [Candidatus Levybacteria bacterium]